MGLTVLTGIQALAGLGFAAVTFALVGIGCALDVKNACSVNRQTRIGGTSAEDEGILIIASCFCAVYAVVTFFLAFSRPTGDLYKRVICYLGFPSVLFAIQSIVWGILHYDLKDFLVDTSGAAKKDSWFAACIGVMALGGIYAVIALVTVLYVSCQNKKSGGGYIV